MLKLFIHISNIYFTIGKKKVPGDAGRGEHTGARSRWAGSPVEE
jgi:hypothetical protein